MPTDTFSITANSNDGHGRRGPTATWAGIGAGAYSDEQYGTGIVVVQQTFDGSNFFLTNAYLRWDTSTLPDSSTITSANLLLFLEGKGDPNNVTWAADFYDFGGTPSVAGDWEATSSGDAITSIDLTALTTSAVNTIALTGLTGISKTGFTGIRIAPATSTQPTGDNFTDFSSLESANQEPRLEVTHTPATGDFPPPRIGRGSAW